MKLVKFTLSIFVIMGLNTIKSQAQTASVDEGTVQELVSPEGEDNFLPTPTDTEDEPCFLWGNYDLIAYPNPAVGSTTIDFGTSTDLKAGSLDGDKTAAFTKNIHFNVELFSPQGVLIKSEKLKLGQKLDLDLSDQAPGIYFVKLTNAQYEIVRVSKLIVK